MPIRFTLRQLEYFVAVGESGSIASASKKLNVSSPSISAAISQLEAQLGLSLFVRKHAHGLSLTEAGQRTVEQSNRILSAAMELNELAGDISGKVQGPLRLGCLLTFAQILVPKLRRTFEDNYTDVQIAQSELTQIDIFSRLRLADLDIALTYDLELPNDLDFTPLLELPPYVLMNAEHPLAENKSVSVSQLNEHPMVLLDLPLSSEYFLSFFRKEGLRPNIAERTKDMAVMRSLVGNGFGYSIANIRSLNEKAPDGEDLIYVPLEGCLRPMRMGFLTARDALKNNTIRAFVSHCEKIIQEQHIPNLTV